VLKTLREKVRDIFKIVKGPHNVQKVEVGNGKLTTMDKAKRNIELLKYMTEHGDTAISSFTDRRLTGMTKASWLT